MGLKMNGFVVQERKPLNMTDDEETTYWDAMETIWVYLLFYVLGLIRDAMERMSRLIYPKTEEANRQGYIPLYCDFEQFYKRHCYVRFAEMFNIPITTMAAPKTKIMERVTTEKCGILKETGNELEIVNFTSYNYLDMNDNSGQGIRSVEQEIRNRGPSVCSTRSELGTLDSHKELETLISQFLGVDDVFTVGMGFATNSTVIPCLVDQESLILSDEKNHSSIVLGCRLSGAAIRVYKHNDMKSLEENIREAILTGNHKTHRAFRKILIIAEGVYSMEGTIVELRDMVRLKKKYKCYLYVDEAHSIGALGRTGRGVCELLGINPRDIDVLMGTFTKSFSASGGYVAGRKEIIDHIRSRAASSAYACAMSPPVVRQVIRTMTALMSTEEGAKKLNRLACNIKYFRTRLLKLGFPIIGHEASPVVPMMICNPSVGQYTIRTLMRHKVGCVYVGFPATELMKGRIRLCLSAGHTRQMLDRVIQILISIDKKASLVKKSKRFA